MVFKNIDKIFQEVKKELSNDADVCSRIISCANKKVGLIYLKSMISAQIFSDSIISPILNFEGEKVNIKLLKEEILRVNDVKDVQTKDDIITNVLLNSVVIIIEGLSGGVSIDIEDFKVRSPEEPPTSAVIQGPREGFTESIKVNMQLLRRRLRTKDLAFEDLMIGKYSNTKVSICYINGVADKHVVKKIKKRLSEVNIDGIIDSYYLVAFLEERPNSIFKQVGSAEKPDVIAAKMLEGRVAILVDNSPIVLTLPFVILEDIQNSNDYYTNNHYVTLIRIVRTLGILVATVVPGVFLSLRLYHYNVMPLKYLITISDSTQGLPFTPFLELIFILILFQILYEVSLRLPRYLGLATSIVGALILGDTGVKAGLISPPGVVIIAMSIISIYVIPDAAPQLTILRAIFLVLGGILGLLGIMAGMIFFINYLSNFNEYGAPYLAPFAPRVKSDTKDGVYKVPITMMKLRPQSYKNRNKTRLK